MSAAAEWLLDIMQTGISCCLVERHRSLGRNGEFKDICLKSVIRIEGFGINTSLEVSSGLSIQVKEITAIECHVERPDLPAFRLAPKEIISKLLTVRWSQTGRQCQTPQYIYLLFKTIADTRAFREGLEMTRKFGVKAVLQGQAGNRCGGVAAPSAWQMERGKEGFRRELGSFGRSVLVVADEPTASTAEVDDFAGLCEPAEVHETWAEVLQGRKATALDRNALQ